MSDYEPMRPCPFCGASAKAFCFSVAFDASVRCSRCKGKCGEYHGRTEREAVARAIKSWNRRAAAQEERKAARGGEG